MIVAINETIIPIVTIITSFCQVLNIYTPCILCLDRNSYKSTENKL